MNFKEFQIAVQKQFSVMKQYKLYRTNVDKDLLWKTYLESFPEGTNPIYKERTEHDCQCCKQFIRAIGNMVAIIDDKLVSIWDIKKIGNGYDVVAKALADLNKSAKIDNVFYHYEGKAGQEKTFNQLVTSEVVSWDHFFIQLPSHVVDKDPGSALANTLSTKDVMLRGLTEITIDSIETVLELISQNSLYRGEENKFVLESFLNLKKEFDKANDKDLFCWSKITSISQSATRIRNSSIGTLLCDISEGIDLDRAVHSFEAKVAPTNYKRPTAVVTKSMIDNAKKTIEELGLTSALERRYATLEDISINNILFADRSAKKKIAANVFDEISETIPVKTKVSDKVEEITIEDFITKVLPQINSIEVMVTNDHKPNFVSLIAPVNPSAKNLFKWNNSFSWSYNGDVADSIKEKVKKAGGKVDGDLRCSLSWFNYDDLDLHMVEPRHKNGNSNEIYYANKLSVSTRGTLDVDMNAGSGTSRSAVENICYPDRNRMNEGVYSLRVHNFHQRETIDVGFTVEIEFDGIIHTFHYDKAVKNKDIVEVAQISYSKKDNLKIIKSIPSSTTPKTEWGVSTQSWKKVSLLMLSPNYWDDYTVGNKHYFFMLEGCKNDGKARGFYNEFLTAELDKHRKVFEIVGSKMRTEEAEHQLSGLGFSSTQRNSLICRVSGNFTRTLKINF